MSIAVQKSKRPREEADDEFNRYFGMNLKRKKKDKCTCKFCGEKGDKAKPQLIEGYTNHLKKMYYPEPRRQAASKSMAATKAMAIGNTSGQRGARNQTNTSIIQDNAKGKKGVNEEPEEDVKNSKTIKKSAAKEKSAKMDLKKKSREKEPVGYYVAIKPAFQKKASQVSESLPDPWENFNSIVFQEKIYVLPSDGQSSKKEKNSSLPNPSTAIKTKHSKKEKKVSLPKYTSLFLLTKKEKKHTSASIVSVAKKEKKVSVQEPTSPDSLTQKFSEKENMPLPTLIIKKVPVQEKKSLDSPCVAQFTVSTVIKTKDSKEGATKRKKIIKPQSAKQNTNMESTPLPLEGFELLSVQETLPTKRFAALSVQEPDPTSATHLNPAVRQTKLKLKKESEKPQEPPAPPTTSAMYLYPSERQSKLREKQEQEKLQETTATPSITQAKLTKKGSRKKKPAGTAARGKGRGRGRKRQKAEENIKEITENEQEIKEYEEEIKEENENKELPCFLHEENSSSSRDILIDEKYRRKRTAGDSDEDYIP